MHVDGFKFAVQLLKSFDRDRIPDAELEFIPGLAVLGEKARALGPHEADVVALLGLYHDFLLRDGLQRAGEIDQDVVSLLRRERRQKPTEDERNYGAPHNLTRLEYLDHTQILTSAREMTFQILKENTSLTEDDLKELKLLDIPTIKDAAFAQEKRIVHEVKYFPVPDRDERLQCGLLERSYFFSQSRRTPNRINRR